MVLEEINRKWLLERPYVSFFLGFIYSLIGYVLATIFFSGAKVSLSMLFITTLFIVPTFVGVLKLEEKIERRKELYDVKSFFLAHRAIIEVYILVFLGAFFGYLALGILAQSQAPVILEYQFDFLSSQEGLDITVLDNFFESPGQSSQNSQSFANVLSILQNNLGVMLICFFLSIVFGAGAIFLLVLNASIFATFGVVMIKYLTTRFAEALQVVAIFSLHLVPEIAGFILVSIAGGVLSRAIMTEKSRSEGFRNVAKDALLLFLIACVLVIIAAFLEVYVTTGLFKSF